MENNEREREVTLKKKKRSSKSKSKWWIWLLILILIVIIAFLVKQCLSDNGKTSTSTEEITIEQPTLVDDVAKTDSISEDMVVTEDEPMAPANEGETIPNEPTIESASSNQATNPVVTNSSNPVFSQETLEEKARRVIRGDFGNGAKRKRALGSEYDAIQQKVNEMYRNRKF